jgi:transcriptional regulator with XRE-family HTH domain
MAPESPQDSMRKRAERHIRKFIGQRLRALRKERGLTQDKLGELSGLSGKFIGEVERGQKSISIDSLYAVAVALQTPLPSLVDVRVGEHTIPPSEDVERIYALMAGPHRQEEVRRAYNVLRAMFGKVS